MKWFHQWRLRRAEKALAKARARVAQRANAVHECAYLEHERELISVVKHLRRKLGIQP